VKNKAPIVLCELLFDDKMFKEKQLEKYSKLFLRFTHENQKAQKYLLGGLEKTVESQEAALLNKVPHIFKILFEEDVLEEEVILEWAKKVSKKYVSKDVAQKIHDKAAPFIKWLKEAEEESDESSEGEIEVDFDTRAHVSRLKETSAEPAKKDTTPELQEKSEEKSEEDDEDDVDIDNI
jgi:translation initiation factor 5